MRSAYLDLKEEQAARKAADAQLHGLQAQQALDLNATAPLAL